MKQYSQIIWDWNGTLLDDVEWSISCINTMLKKRGLATLNSKAEYHQVFDFPIVEYYRRLGFDFSKESFEKLAVEYIDLYHSSNEEISLFEDVTTTLAVIHELGLGQVILSASESSNLKSQISTFDVAGYFDEILGISDIYATEKISLGQKYIDRIKCKNEDEYNPHRIVLIGDTTHDKAVADALGIDCILVARGHQSHTKLNSTSPHVTDNFAGLIGFFTLVESE
ncbi:MAG: HAD family hydrolase [Oscillospiraceae bacterium]|nr:HAD family hydrolase [Oscillospiraceae bacterium]